MKMSPGDQLSLAYALGASLVTAICYAAIGEHHCLFAIWDGCPGIRVICYWERRRNIIPLGWLECMGGRGEGREL